MERLLLCFCLGLLFSCGNQVGEKDETSSSVVDTPKLVAVKDTQPHRPGYIIDRARQQKDIKADFPFDIPLRLADGTNVNSKDVFAKSDRPKVLLFWLTTCYPCRLEMKAINENYHQWQSEQAFDLYAISTDFQKNFPAFTKKVNQSNWPWKTFNDTNREFRRIMPGKLNGLPQVFILNKDGEIVHHKRKYQSGDEHLLFEKIKEAAKS